PTSLIAAEALRRSPGFAGQAEGLIHPDRAGDQIGEIRVRPDDGIPPVAGERDLEAALDLLPPARVAVLEAGGADRDQDVCSDLVQPEALGEGESLLPLAGVEGSRQHAVARELAEQLRLLRRRPGVADQVVAAL